jgi:hypothetical protein
LLGERPARASLKSSFYQASADRYRFRYGPGGKCTLHLRGRTRALVGSGRRSPRNDRVARVNPGLPIRRLRLSCVPAPPPTAPEYCSFWHLSSERRSAISCPPNRCVSNKSAAPIRADTLGVWWEIKRGSETVQTVSRRWQYGSSEDRSWLACPQARLSISEPCIGPVLSLTALGELRVWQ